MDFTPIKIFSNSEENRINKTLFNFLIKKLAVVILLI